MTQQIQDYIKSDHFQEMVREKAREVLKRSDEKKRQDLTKVNCLVSNPTVEQLMPFITSFVEKQFARR